MKRLARAILLAVLCASAGAASASAGIDLAPNPPWCPPKYRCLKISEYEAMTVVKIELERDLALARKRARRFGCVAGAGAGISGVVTEDLALRTVPAAHLGVTCGWIF